MKRLPRPISLLTGTTRSQIVTIRAHFATSRRPISSLLAAHRCRLRILASEMFLAAPSVLLKGVCSDTLPREPIWAAPLQIHRCDGFANGALVVVVRQAIEIASQCLERVTFAVDLFGRAKAESPKNRKRWAPAIERVLNQK